MWGDTNSTVASAVWSWLSVRENRGEGPPAIAVIGSRQSGKSRLLSILCGGRVHHADTLSAPAAASFSNDAPVAIDDAERADPLALFAWINAAMDGSAPLLLAAQRRPAAWPAAASPVPDLTSRLNALPVLVLDAPDDALLSSALTEALRQAGVRASHSAIEAILPRVCRRFDSVLAIANSAGRLSMEIPSVKALLEAALSDNPGHCRA